MLTLKERARWAISHVAERDGLSNTKIGKRIGVKGDTVNSYRSMATDPKVEFIVTFCEQFELNELWFLRGAGEPFPGARELYPDVCGEPIDPASFIEGGAVEAQDGKGLWGKTRQHEFHGKHFTITQIEPNKTKPSGKQQAPVAIGQAVDLLNMVLSSGDQVFIQALVSNLVAFNQAIQQTKEQSARITELEKKCEDLKKRLSTLEKKL